MDRKLKGMGPGSGTVRADLAENKEEVAKGSLRPKVKPSSGHGACSPSSQPIFFFEDRCTQTGKSKSFSKQEIIFASEGETRLVSR